jgi:hypothetical protein
LINKPLKPLYYTDSHQAPKTLQQAENPRKPSSSIAYPQIKQQPCLQSQPSYVLPFRPSSQTQTTSTHKHTSILQQLTNIPPLKQPLTTTRLTQIATDACTSALSTATTYQHDSTGAWNNAIINRILQALISETTAAAAAEAQASFSDPADIEGGRYKFAVNSTIIQHLSEPSEVRGGDGGAIDGGASEVKREEGEGEVKLEGGEGAAGEPRKVGRRGMHSASGAYWNNERDGMWSFKYEGGESKGMDIVVSVMWIGV